MDIQVFSDAQSNSEIQRGLSLLSLGKDISFGHYLGLNSSFIDGGGIRGLSSLIILREVLYRIKVKDDLPDIPRPCDLFDLAGGSGTGGYISYSYNGEYGSQVIF